MGGVRFLKIRPRARRKRRKLVEVPFLINFLFWLTAAEWAFINYQVLFILFNEIQGLLY